jgi:hypothetical protein
LAQFVEPSSIGKHLNFPVDRGWDLARHRKWVNRGSPVIADPRETDLRERRAIGTLAKAYVSTPALELLGVGTPRGLGGWHVRKE